MKQLPSSNNYRQSLLVFVVLVISFSTLQFNTSPALAATANLNGTFTPSHQHDFYSIIIPVGGNVVIGQIATSDCNLDSYLFLRGSNGNVVAQNDSSNPNQTCGKDNAQITYTAATAGTYVIDATTCIASGIPSSCSLQPRSAGAGTTGNYALTISGNFTLITTTSGSAVTFFNPGDNRVDPRPGDRIAVWCNPPDTIVVYGVKETDSGGFWLVSFSNKALLHAGKNVGIYKPVPNNGQISLSTDGQGNYWAAWNGGEHKADGEPGHGFGKGFQCNFPTQ